MWTRGVQGPQQRRADQELTVTLYRSDVSCDGCHYATMEAVVVLWPFFPLLMWISEHIERKRGLSVVAPNQAKKTDVQPTQ
jgi:hypothetical protein